VLNDDLPDGLVEWIHLLDGLVRAVLSAVPPTHADPDYDPAVTYVRHRVPV
jgi:hypothetical protein